jgi:hypothetical protein
VPFQSACNAILNAVQDQSRVVWTVTFALEVLDFSDGVLTLRFGSNKELDNFKNQAGAPDTLRAAIHKVLGVEVKFKPQIAAAAQASSTPAAAATAPVLSSAAAKAAAVAAGLTPPAVESKINKAAAKVEPKPAKVAPTAKAPTAEVAAEVASEPAAVTEQLETIVPPAAEPKVAPTEEPVEEDARYGESLVRELLGGIPIEDTKNGR